MRVSPLRLARSCTLVFTFQMDTVFRSLIFRKRDSWYALIVRQGRQAELVPFDIFDLPLYTKILHAVLALPDVSGKRKYEVTLFYKEICNLICSLSCFE